MGTKPVLLNKVDLKSSSTHKSDNMTNIELYINNTLCDINNPESLGVRLNRVLINPSELNTKDAQYSYSITIPSTPQNDAIFGYANIEETKNKFNRFFNSQLYVDSVKIFDGQFKLSEIDTEGNYKGNLVVPAPKTIKEIFGEKKMNEVGEWLIDVNEKNAISGKEKEVSFPQFISNMNLKEEADCIFPLVLYGLLPKQPKIDANGDKIYTGKTLWDDQVRLGVADFPPSINCLKAIQKIFESMKDDNDRPVNVSGSAFADERLKGLYMSYQNPVDYEQPWNWGQLGRMHLRGTWTNIDNDNYRIPTTSLESRFFRTQGDYDHVTVNLFQAKNSQIEIVEDGGNNIIQTLAQSENVNQKAVASTHVVIPVSGFYKVKLSANLHIRRGNERGRSNKDYGTRFAYFNNEGGGNLFPDIRYELKLLRSRDDSDFNLENQVIDGVFFQKNQKRPQDTVGVFGDEYPDYKGFPKYETFPKYFPQPGEIQFIDLSQNRHFVCGLHWGINAELKDRGYNPVDINPDKIKSWVMAAKSGMSWDYEIDDVNYSAINAPASYWAYDLIRTNPGEDIHEEHIGYIRNGHFKVDLTNSPENRCDIVDEQTGNGEVNMIVWLEKGEKLSVVDVVDLGRFNSYKKNAYIKHEVSFDLQIEPYRTNQDWVKVDLEGTGTGAMDWEDDRKEGLFPKSTIDLIKFLPSEQKVDEWLDNFCKAFNLQLTQPAPYKFELNVKQQKQIASAGSVVDLDGKASIVKRSNQPLDLPSAYQLGFKINKEEEGYEDYPNQNNGDYDDGGGRLDTGSIGGKELTQSSTFSYNWFKPIEYGWDILLLPIIAHKEIWENPRNPIDYEEMMPKLYTHYTQRFWYRSDIYDAGNVWNNGKENEKSDSLVLSMVSNRMRGGRTLLLNYHNKPNTILTTYFNVIVGADSNYTEVECYLTPDEYERLDGSCYAKLNGDLYFIASVEGYDPIGRNSTKLKLIRKV